MDNILNLPENNNYEGYVWKSDSTKPILVNGRLPECIHSLKETSNPYILEALLFDREKYMSYSIKNIDGKYIINKKEVPKQYCQSSKELNLPDNITLKKYYGNRMEGKRMVFLQYWAEEEDIFNKSIKVLRPAEVVFIGFEQIIKDKEN